MDKMSKPHNLIARQKFLSVFENSDYVQRYLDFCDKFEADGDIDGPRMDLVRVADLFREEGIATQFNKRFKVIIFSLGEAAGWSWQGKLVIQRYDMLEPMFEGETLEHVVGSTMLGLAIDVGDRRTPPVPRSRFLPPHPNRPRFDGDMRTMERMVPDLVALTRWMCERIAETWDAPPTDGPA